MIKIAITGGIGSGKSSVCSYLESKGYTVIYADKIARGVTAAGGRAIPYILENFGPDYLCEDGSMNRAKMRELVMNDKSKLALLEEGTTKLAKRIIDDMLEEADKSGNDVIFVEVALLFETNAQNEYDSSWLVVADMDTRILRIMNRDNIEREAAVSIINNQMPDREKIKLCKEIIYNDSDVENLRISVDNLLNKYNIGR